MRRFAATAPICTITAANEPKSHSINDWCMFACVCAGVSLFGEESRERRRSSHEKNHLPVQVDEERSQEAARDPAKTRNSRFLLLLFLTDFDKLLCNLKIGQKMEHKPWEMSKRLYFRTWTTHFQTCLNGSGCWIDCQTSKTQRKHGHWHIFPPYYCKRWQLLQVEGEIHPEVSLEEGCDGDWETDTSAAKSVRA